MTKTVEHEWEVELPATTPEQLLAALAARDRLFGQTITLEPEDDAANSVEVWLGTADTLVDHTFHLGLYAEMTGPEDYLEAARDALDEIIAEQLEGGADDAAKAELLGRRPAAEVEFRMVEEDDERPQLILPEWLAPGEVELPWSFRPYTSDGAPWPADDVLEAHDRVALVPSGDDFVLYALPAVEEEEEPAE